MKQHKQLKIFKYFHYLLREISKELRLDNFRMVRMYKGGTWYKHTMTGELPGCHGSWWSRTCSHHRRYVYIEAIETY